MHFKITVDDYTISFFLSESKLHFKSNPELSVYFLQLECSNFEFIVLKMHFSFVNNSNVTERKKYKQRTYLFVVNAYKIKIHSKY